MRIVHLIDTASRLAGGLSESLKGLALAMLANGDDVQVIAGLDKWSATDRPTWAPLRLTEVTTTSFQDKILGETMLAALDAAAPDIVHLHGIWGTAARATATWVRRTGCPHVVSAHGMLDPWAWRRSRAKKRVSQWLWEDRLLRRARLLHALSVPEAEVIAQYGFGPPIATIPNGVTLPTATANRALREAKRILLFVGRVHPKKGLQELISAWALVASTVRERWRVVIAGWDEVGIRTSLEAQVSALGLADEIEFVGQVFGADKDNVFREASAFILPSHSEGLPMTVLEAWSYGLPVLMTRACNLPKGFEVGAAFPITTVPADMAVAMGAFLSDELALANAGSRGRALVEAEHGWATIGREMVAAYRAAV